MVVTDVVEAVKNALEEIDSNYCKLSQIDYEAMNQDLKEGLQEQKFLERPFAYEFYHQLRKLMDSKKDNKKVDFGGPIIQAEVPKRYQHCFKNGKIPDFIIHVPNNRDKNLAVIEFKMATNISGLKDDFEKLVEFKTHPDLKYKNAIEVIIGNPDELKKANRKIDSLESPNGEVITLIEFNTEKQTTNAWTIKYSATDNITVSNYVLNDKEP